jgi:membrane fusion protein
VPSRDIGFVAVGCAVALRYHAYPYEKFGQQSGHVSEVAQSALSAAEASRVLGRDVSSPLFRVIVELDQQTLPAFGAALPLRASMTLDADILLERRRLIEWLFAPAPSQRAANRSAQASGADVSRIAGGAA